MWSESETLVRVEEIQGRGRGLVSCKPLRGGDIVLRDSLILVYSALPLITKRSRSLSCDNCCRKLNLSDSEISSSQCCSHHKFCSPRCLSASSHTPWVCHALSLLHDSPSSVEVLHHQPLERQLQVRFLIAAHNLSLISPTNFQILLSLQGQARVDDEDAQFLHSFIISTLCPGSPTSPAPPFFSLELTSSLLAKDKLNAFGLMEPFPFNDNGENDGHRSVRAYGIYPKASLFNHDCLPNACRFDYVDTSPSGSDHNNIKNTDLIIRMIHDVPHGREICLSYFPVNYDYSTRQKRLLEDYGFICDCDRCKVEANWSDQEHDDDDDDDAMEIMEEEEEEEEDPPNDESMEEDDASSFDNTSDFPHAYFFLRYMCNRTNCWGTLAPLSLSNANPTSGTNNNLLECNVCGNIKTDEVGVDAESDPAPAPAPTQECSLL